MRWSSRAGCCIVHDGLQGCRGAFAYPGVKDSLTWINQGSGCHGYPGAIMSPRLITLTLNPALDLDADADEVVPTHKIRMHHEHADPGGGGVNVARVLHELGADVVAILAAGGASGRVLEEMLDEAG